MKKLIVKICRFFWKIRTFFHKVKVQVWRTVIKSSFAECGKNVYLEYGSIFKPEVIHVGNDVSIGAYCRIQGIKGHIYIGNHIMIASFVTMSSGNHRTDIVGRYMKSVKTEEQLPENNQDIVIEDDVWIGTKAVILKGVRIGRGSVIGAGAVVTRDVPPYSIYTGVPESKIRRRFTDAQIEEHENILKKMEMKKD